MALILAPLWKNILCTKILPISWVIWFFQQTSTVRTVCCLLNYLWRISICIFHRFPVCCVRVKSLYGDTHTLFAITLTLDDLVFYDMDSISYRGLPSSGCKTPFGSRSYELLWITLEHQELLWINSKPKDLLRTISGPQNTYQIIRLA